MDFEKNAQPFTGWALRAGSPVYLKSGPICLTVRRSSTFCRIPSVGLAHSACPVGRRPGVGLGSNTGNEKTSPSGIK